MDAISDLTQNGAPVLAGLTIAGALGDAVANPSATPSVATYGLIWDDSTTSWLRARGINAFKTAAAAPDVGIAGHALVERRYTSVTLAAALNSAQTWDTMAAAEALVVVGATTTGTIIFEVTSDGSTWVSAEAWDVTNNRTVSGVALTPTSGVTYRVNVGGHRTLRVRVASLLGATVGLIANLSPFVHMPVRQDTGQGRSLLFAAISAATSGNNTLVAAAAAGLKIKVVSYVLVADGTVTATFQSGAAGTALSGAMALVANSGVSVVGQPSSHLMETAAATLLNLSLSAAVGVRGHLSYFLEP